jgi:hypothetical protein
MDQATEYVQQNSGMIGAVVFIIFALTILYVVYGYLYPGTDSSFKKLLKGEASAKKAVKTATGAIPKIFTGGDFTLSMWIYIDDWNYRMTQNKFLFSIDPVTLSDNSVSPIVGILTPYQNGLMIRTSTMTNSSAPPPGQVSTTTGTPDITRKYMLDAMMNQQTSMSMFQSTVDSPCNIKEVPLQKWVCITVVSSGRVLDVYMDGKLSRSCVMDTNVNVPKGDLVVSLGKYGGFGGRYSSVQMWNQELTPDVIYGIYMMGPTQTQHNIFTDIAKYFNINVSFTGSLPGSVPDTTTQGGCSKADALQALLSNSASGIDQTTDLVGLFQSLSQYSS